MERIEAPTIRAKMRFHFPHGIDPSSVLVETKGLCVGYKDAILPPLAFRLRRGEKVALVGFNGIGKSTLIRTLLGEITPINGKIKFGEGVVPQYFAQESDIAQDVSALDFVWRAYPNLTQTQVRQALASCGLKSEHIFQPLSSLSGGEQTKVRLCKMTLGIGNWLILDEPTNHLDVEAKRALQSALRDYPGAVLIVTHEPEFYEGWIHRTWDISKMDRA